MLLIPPPSLLHIVAMVIVPMPYNRPPMPLHTLQMLVPLMKFGMRFLPI